MPKIVGMPENHFPPPPHAQSSDNAINDAAANENDSAASPDDGDITEPAAVRLPAKSDGDLTLIATCAFGLESIVKRELVDLGIESAVESSGRLKFFGPVTDMIAANTHLRCADRVLIEIAQFDAPDFDALFDTTKSIRWDRWIPVDGRFPVEAKSISSTLTSVPAIQRSVKKAVSDALGQQHAGKQSQSDESQPDESQSEISQPDILPLPPAVLPETGAMFRIEAAILRDRVSLTLDTTGRSLHRRGYRTDITAAPLKETLAAALVLLSFWRNGRPLLDPFCGSGTIPIEAAMIGRRIAPGLGRLRAGDFAFSDWPMIAANDVETIADQAAQNELPSLDVRLVGRDIDHRALRAARDNARRAGVENDVHFEPGDVRQTNSPQRFGCLITNPPYGERIGEDVAQLYAELPTVLARLPTWSHYVFTSVGNFETIVGKPADRRRKLYNGRIACTYFQYQGPKPVAEQKEDVTLVHAVGEAAFGGVNEKAKHQSDLFAARLTNRARHLRRFPTRRGITCYRLYERDVPEIPLVVDRYEDHLHITEYERPHDRDPAAHVAWLDLMAKTAGETLDVKPENVHFKSRTRQRGKTQHEKVSQTDDRIVVNEGGHKFLVNLDDYVDTGLFLDHRITRQMVAAQAKGKRLLNLFCYTGSFTVYAAAAGAASTASVDLSSTYTRWTSENLSINRLASDDHQVFTMDVREFIRDHSKGTHYDLVVLDPPTFSNSKKTDQDWDVARHSSDLIRDLLPLVSDGGVIYFSSNFRRLKFDPSELPISAHHEISKQTVPDDFRNRRIHRCWRLVK